MCSACDDRRSRGGEGVERGERIADRRNVGQLRARGAEHVVAPVHTATGSAANASRHAAGSALRQRAHRRLVLRAQRVEELGFVAVAGDA